MDGLKTSLVTLVVLSREKYSEIKVAQFGGYVSEHSGYHHGERFMKAIVGMAQNFVGQTTLIYHPVIENAYKVKICIGKIYSHLTLL